jgi:membrane protease YdiL (CAAX protease family)
VAPSTLILWTLALVLVAHVLPSLWSVWEIRRASRKTAAKGGGQGPNPEIRFLGWRLLVRQLFIAAFGIITFRLGAWGWSDVAGRSEVHPGIAFFAGAVGFVVFYFFYLFRLYQRGKLDQQEEHINRTGRLIWPSKRWEKIPAFFAIVILNPVNEEVIFRGILLVMWTQVLGSIWLPLAVGLFLHLLAHAYQGWVAVGGFIILFTCFSTIVFSPLGIWGAIGFHVMADLVPISLMRPRPQT